ncbi:hypothetical protein TREMEDRAFT_27464 [Tremella mesenterica DSM 1558]|uniref:uncharacterized protein n=1 Tax=Tremella mesenterica (strain ATCC 24925 / CBS 8224 / DSM 1558 / NBRC 9311 / NRRL Y-6157 / RJB 2259-6 / UBC 559-6) TaxID=578456 RepID=UPI0003F49726|nr:uncharacterized protein TREMEDRAFT_27464 [Tremella mesenterica DSM 1558]EIW71227.1 hypothetical protein TREMEDRAFT_27464 [Tremella mesenterica DSM 1558]
MAFFTLPHGRLHTVYTLEGRHTSQRSSEPPSSRAKRPAYVAHPASQLVCRPFGECEPCPKDQLSQPFCMPFGNRRLLHCIPKDDQHRAQGTTDGSQPAGEVPAWEACGKVVKKEQRDFWEFVTTNLLFLIVALTILWARTSALATAQYRQLAARIGIPGGSWRT